MSTKEWRDSHKDHIKRINNQWQIKNKDSQLMKARQYYANNKDKVKVKRLMSDYSLTQSQYNTMIVNQRNECAICKKSFTHESKNSIPHVDHNHNTGVVCGLLCGQCNTKLGWVERFYECIFTYLRKK